MAENLSCSKTQQAIEYSKGFKVHDFERYSQRNYVLKWEENLCHQKCVIYFLFEMPLTSKNIRKRAQI